MVNRKFMFTLIASATFFHGVAFADETSCNPLNFKEITLDISNESQIITSLLIAYPDVTYAAQTNLITFASGLEVLFEPETARPSDAILKSPTVGDQFRYVYPLDFDLTQRTAPWNDPGRVRNDSFMRALYFDSKRAARKSLTKIETVDGRASFRVTEKNGVACQLQAVLNQLGGTHPKVFENIGGSFNWRNISGTERLSVHSFGAAVDVNTNLGGYWKWSGEDAGAVGSYNNSIPEDVVEAFEKYGFIWGGKWHHFDGMHFEYRPELIVYSRLVSLGQTKNGDLE